MQERRKATEMNSVKITLLSVFTLTALAMWGIGFYATGAAADRAPSQDGYGIIAQR